MKNDLKVSARLIYRNVRVMKYLFFVETARKIKTLCQIQETLRFSSVRYCSAATKSKSDFSYGCEGIKFRIQLVNLAGK